MAADWEQPPPPKRNAPWILVLIAIVVVIGIGGAIAAIALARSDNDDDGTVDTTSTLITALDPSKTYTATMSTTQGDIVITMDTEHAQVGAAHFINLAQEGFYDGLSFHRVVPDFVIQGGDPEGTGAGGAGNPVVAETPTDGYSDRFAGRGQDGVRSGGDLRLAVLHRHRRAGDAASPDYAWFGMVTSGLDVAQAIEALAPPEGDGAPTEPAKIKW